VEQAIDLPLASPFWIAIGYIGRGLIIAGLASFLLSVVQQFTNRLPRVPFFLIGCISVFGAFLSLGSLFVADQFQYHYVWSHSEKINGFWYKVAAIWSGQQGSFLLWATCSGIFALLALKGTGAFRRGYVATISAFLASICGILAYETPFRLQSFQGKVFIPPDGTGLAPSLNNYWVIIHPPTIFLGFGSLVVLFAYAVSALASRDYNGWVPRVRPWALVSVTLLGLGLCMGGFWAYETLGWGGFWMWDPVENVSFVPWVVAIALIHGLIVQTTKNKWHFSNLMLAGAPFMLFVYGTFLTRAGFLADVSVHSFATMEKNAHRVLLGLLFVSLGGFIGLWVHRLMGHMRAQRKLAIPAAPREKGVHREGLYQLGIVFLVLLGAATAIGMSVPLFQALQGRMVKVVEEHLYHQVLSYFFIPTMILMAITPFSSWRQMSAWGLFLRVLNVLSITLGVVGITMFILNNPAIGVRPDPEGRVQFSGGVSVPLFGWITFLFGLCIFVAVANLWRLVEVMKRSRTSAGAFLSHLGVAVALAGLIVSRGFEREQRHYVQNGSTGLPIFPKGVRSFVELVPEEWNLEDRNNKIAFRFFGDEKNFVARPGLYYAANGGDGQLAPVVWPHIQRYASHDLYVALSPAEQAVGKPREVKVGETFTFTGPVWSTLTERDYEITYSEFTREGEGGASGTKFGAKLKIKDPAGHILEVNPKFVVGKGPEPAVIDDEFEVSMSAMDAASKNVTLEFGYRRPVLILHTFYKPLTILVWIGVGILTFGGFLSAWHRRRRPAVASTESVVENVEENDDALVPVA